MKRNPKVHNNTGKSPPGVFGRVDQEIRHGLLKVCARFKGEGGWRAQLWTHPVSE